MFSPQEITAGADGFDAVDLNLDISHKYMRFSYELYQNEKSGLLLLSLVALYSKRRKLIFFNSAALFAICRDDWSEMGLHRQSVTDTYSKQQISKQHMTTQSHNAEPLTATMMRLPLDS